MTETTHEEYCAAGYAACAHKDQKRKYTEEPYVKHCEEVAMILATYIDDAEVLCAAWLHDTVEDTSVTYDDIKWVFSERVADLVLEVTDVSKPEDGNRKQRKALDHAHLAKSSVDGANIKLADMISNTQSIVKHDKDFARIYLPEKESLLSVLRHGNQDLWRRAKATVEDAYLLLGLGEPKPTNSAIPK